MDNYNLNKKSETIVALAGNPNVGKSTVFNAMTGLNQHTGNWPGKTVSNASGEYTYKNRKFTIVDLPGTYSLMSDNAEEEITRDYICFENPDVVLVVVDATCLERNLLLVLQVLEITNRVVVCVNLLDEAKKKGIFIDLDELSLQLGIPVIGACARSNIGIKELEEAIYNVSNGITRTFSVKLPYDEKIENAIEKINLPDYRWLSLKCLENDKKTIDKIKVSSVYDINLDKYIIAGLDIKNELNLTDEEMRDSIIASIVSKSESIYHLCVNTKNENYNERDRKIDKLLTSKLTGIPVMILLMGIIFWITITGANYPSQWLSALFEYIGEHLTAFLQNINTPDFITGPIIDGVYKTVTWVVSVMLPPMAIFFPLFTLLEDSGYLPRIAFNMDSFFRRADAHGKQALTTLMGFGCNACGVTGCRIINSPRERLIAIITNNFVPCNGRFPTLISIITMFFVGTSVAWYNSLMSAGLLVLIILIGIAMTLIVSKTLSHTLLKGVPSNFTLELPSYRRPQFGKVIVRSICDRTLFVLGRAVAVAAPAGLIIWILANVDVNGVSLLNHFTQFLDPFAYHIGLDGVILAAFIIGIPANEIVLPIALMAYLSNNVMVDAGNLLEMHQLLVANGWTYITAICVTLFSVMHFPCSTTLITIYKETKSLKWTVLSFVIPTLTGLIICSLTFYLSQFVNLIF